MALKLDGYTKLLEEVEENSVLPSPSNTLLIEDKEKDLEHIDKDSPQASSFSHHQQRDEIQTLRAIAILSVLLFHLWGDEEMHYGYLGVDVFFVISGYLMCQILSSKQPINFSKICQFYERRLKRIVPLYLFVISLALFSLFYLLDSTQYQQSVKESVHAMFFVSNWPKTVNNDYFSMESKFFFFLHTWSLSVELQFYLIVPLIFLFFDALNTKCERFLTILRIIFLVSIIFVSFLYQFLVSNHNMEHMSLGARIWQFLCGFLAHKIYDKTQKNEEDKFPLIGVRKICAEFIYFLTVFFLIFTLLFGFPLYQHKQISRLLIICLVSIILSQKRKNDRLMANRAIIMLGDISYSIYLIHWPLITWFRYTQLGETDKISIEAGLSLLLSSLIFGLIIEHTFKFLLKYVTTWSLLLSVILLGYALNAFLLLRLEENAFHTKDDSKFHGTPFLNLEKIHSSELNKNSSLITSTINPILSTTLNPEEKKKMLKEYNSVAIRDLVNFAFCEDKLSPIPTNYNLNWTSFSRTMKCKANGTGTKNIVLIGNSHAIFNYFGIMNAFKDVYKTLWTDMRMSCLPNTLSKYQQTERSAEEKEECVRFIKEYQATLEQWQEPIDILIAVFAFVEIKDFPLDTDHLEKDELFMNMQEFYQNLSKIPKEVMIIQKIGPLFKDILSQVYAAVLQNNKDVKTIGDTKKSMLARTPNLRQRMNLLNCSSKCLKMDFLEDLWCPGDENKFCPAVDLQSEHLYFLDRHHPSPLGGIKQAKHMRQEYDEFLKKVG